MKTTLPNLKIKTTNVICQLFIFAASESCLYSDGYVLTAIHPNVPVNMGSYVMEKINTGMPTFLVIFMANPPNSWFG